MKTNDVIVVGLSTAFNTNFDGATALAQFRFKGLDTTGDFSIYAESDDATTDVAPVDTGINWVAGTYTTLRIDFTNLAAVKFSVDGVDVSPNSFDMSAVTANTGMQPFIGLYKPSAANRDHIANLW